MPGFLQQLQVHRLVEQVEVVEELVKHQEEAVQEGQQLMVAVQEVLLVQVRLEP